MEHREVQRIARETMAYLAARLRPGMRLTEVRALCEAHMRELGADSFWYHGIGALVFAGEETALSVSGREYVTGEREIGAEDIVTVDLSPQKGDVWGDYARTLILEDGVVRRDARDVRRGEWRRGLEMEERLHEELRRFAAPDTTFHQLHARMNAFIERNGYVNLDFHGNLGHTIARRMDDRLYTEAGNLERLGEHGLFTFEPHIGLPGSPYGYKMENIYGFRDGRLFAL